MVNIDIRTFYKNDLRESHIGKTKPDSFVNNCIMDPRKTGLHYLKFADNVYDIDLSGLRNDEQARLTYLIEKGVPENLKAEGEEDISLVKFLNTTVNSYYDIPDYNNDDGDEYPEGCSKIDITAMSDDEKKQLKLNTTNIKLKFDGKTYEIIHKDKIQLLFNRLFDNPNKILVFFQVLLITVIILFIYSIIGVCFEFWIRYGYAKNCIYYRNNCNTINKELSVIDYVFPNELCDYPYQRCNPTNKFKEGLEGGLKGGLKRGLKGGANEKPNGFVSKFTEYKAANAKCINIHTETIFAGRPIPYNIADYAQDNFSNEYVRSLCKTISFTFLYYVLASRRVLNFILSNASRLYQNGKGNLILGNIVFLVLSGLIFGLIAALAGETAILAGAMWPLAFIFAVIGIVSICMNVALFLTYIAKFFMIIRYAIYSVFNPEEQFKKTQMDYIINMLYKDKTKCPININDYYVLINDDKCFISTPIMPENAYKNPRYILKFIGCLLLNFIILILWLVWRLGIIPFVMFIMSIISMLYIYIVIPLKMFYVPLSNPLETFSLLKDHADLLVIFLCLGILSACYAAFNYKVTGIVGGLIAILIIMKVSKGLSTLGF